MNQQPIRLFVPTFDVESCLAQVRECLERGWTGMGWKTEEFEKTFAQYTKLPKGVFVNSGSSAIQLALEVLRNEHNWEPGDEVITSPFTFVSANHAITHARLKPVFADINDCTLNLDPVSVEERITPRTKAVLFVGIGGNSAGLDGIEDICKEHDLKLIIDAAHMCGTLQNRLHAGHNADAVAFSFQAVKNLPTGDSGLITFPQAPKLASEARQLSWCGIDRDTYERTKSAGTYRWEYEVLSTGHKFNGNSIMAALALAQLPHIDRDNAYRRFLADRYEQNLKHLKNRIRFFCHNKLSARHLAQVEILPCDSEGEGISTRGCSRDEVMAYLNSVGIYCGVHYKDNTLYPMYRDAKPCPTARAMSRRIISLPLHMKLSTADVDRVCDALAEAVLR